MEDPHIRTHFSKRQRTTDDPPASENIRNPVAAQIVILALSGDVVDRTDSDTCPTAGAVRTRLARAKGFPERAAKLCLQGGEVLADHPLGTATTLTVTFQAPRVTAAALKLAASKGFHGEVEAILAAAKGQPRRERLLLNSKALLVAARDGQEDCVAAILTATKTATQRRLLLATDVRGHTALICAAARGRQDCVRCLLSAAAAAGPSVLERVLVTQGGAVTTLSGTALIHSVREGHLACLWAILMAATAKGPALLERLLLSAVGPGFTALHAASMCGREACVSAILTTAIAVSPTVLERMLLPDEGEGPTALHCAVARGSTACVSVLLEAAATLGRQTLRRLLAKSECVFGGTALQLAERLPEEHPDRRQLCGMLKDA